MTRTNRERITFFCWSAVPHNSFFPLFIHSRTDAHGESEEQLTCTPDSEEQTTRWPSLDRCKKNGFNTTLFPGGPPPQY